MFFFGEDTSLVVKYYIDKTRSQGPKFAEGHFTEMSEKDAREYYIHTYMAYNEAKQEEASEEILDALEEEFIAAFRHVIRFSDDIVKSVRENRFAPPNGSKQFYRNLVEELWNPSEADAG